MITHAVAGEREGYVCQFTDKDGEWTDGTGLLDGIDDAVAHNEKQDAEWDDYIAGQFAAGGLAAGREADSRRPERRMLYRVIYEEEVTVR